MDRADPIVAAVVLAAGRSQRMGTPKLVLPWGEKTIIEQVVSSLIKADVSEVVVVTGSSRGLVESVLSRYDITTVFNPVFLQDDMVKSLQIGISILKPRVDAALIVLGDQPQLKVDVVKKMISVYQEQMRNIIIPSFAHRRGHPWIVPRVYWQELNEMQPPKTMRDFLSVHTEDICYVEAGDDSVLHDIDTQDEYETQKP